MVELNGKKWREDGQLPCELTGKAVNIDYIIWRQNIGS